MGKLYYRPGVFAEEIDAGDEAIQPATSSNGALQGVTRKGPVNVPLGPFYNLNDWEAVLGGPEQDYKQWYHVRAFFKNGGQELYYNRIAHYTDPTDPNTRTGTVASRTLQTADSGPSAGFYDATSAVAPYVLSTGLDFTVDIDNGGVATATFTAAAANLTSGSAETYNITGDVILTVKIDQGTEQSITIPVAEVTSGAATAAQVAAALNSRIVGAQVEDASGSVKITSDKSGTDSYVQVTGGTANATLNFSTTETQGTGNVADVGAVTYEEAKTVIEAAISGCTLAQLGGGYIRIISDTTGATSEVDVQGGTAMALLGFSAGTGVGSDSATENTLKLEFGWRGYDSPGVEPNGHLTTKAYKNPLHPSEGAGSDLAADTGASAVTAQLLDLEGLLVGSIIKIWDGTNTEYRQLTKVESVIESGALKHKIYWEDALTNAYTAAAGMVESREFAIDVYWDDEVVENWVGLNMLDTHDAYVETILNDEATGSKYLYVTDLDATNGLGADIPADDSAATAMTTAGTSEVVGLASTDYIGDESEKLGVHAFDDIAILVDQIAFPGYTDATAAHYLSQWCSERMFIFPTFAVPLTYDRAAALAYRKSTLGLYSKYGSLEYPGMKVYDPLSKASRPMITITSEAHVMGLRARVDAIPGQNDGGVWSLAAGEGKFGQLLDVMDMEREVSDSDQVALHPKSVNCARKFEGKIYRYGGRTLDSDIDWQYENVVRFFMFFEKSTVRGTRWAVHRNNNYRLWRKLEDVVDAFAENLQENRAFPGETKAENWYVKVGVDKGTMDENDVDSGTVIGEIGLAPNKPAEFVVWRFSQFKSGAFSIE